jgi:hypothetical protein
MAFLPRMSIWGRRVGLTRETTDGTGQQLYSERGFSGPALYLQATEPSANSGQTKVDIEGLTTVTTQTTADTALSVRGISIIPAGASTLYTLAGPAAAGVRKAFFTTSTSTLSRQVKSAVAIYTGASVGGGSGTIAASSGMTVISFTGLGNYVELVGLSTAAWATVNIQGYSTAAAPLSS